MNYHLHHEGRDLGVFPLEELRRRLRTGELSGAEMVWHEGAADWQRLDSLLPLPPPVPQSSPPPPPRRRASRLSAPVIVIIAVLFVGGMTLTAFLVSKVVRHTRFARQKGVSEGTEITAKKITWTTNTATEIDARKRAGKFRTRQWLEGYKANGEHNRACDADAVQMIEAWIGSNFGEKGNLTDVIQRCDKLAAAPDCDDPLVLTVTGLNSIELHEKSRRLERALALFPQSRHTVLRYHQVQLRQLRPGGTPARANAVGGGSK